MYFQKYEACGNDYVLVDSSVCGNLDWSRLAQEICKRRFSVGADGLLVVSPAASDEAHARMRIFNPDGSEADMCGNGVRCVAKYFFTKYIAAKYFFTKYIAASYVIKNGDKHGISDVDSSVFRNIPVVAKIQTNCGVKAVTMRNSSGGECFSVNMGSAQVGKSFTLAVLDRVFSVVPVDVGNPHAVIFLEESVNDFPLEKYAPLIENDAMFPNKTNVEFAFVSSRDEIISKIWERGVGETLSCGTGACAVFAAALSLGLVGNRARIVQPGGTLFTSSFGSDIILDGEARHVYDGEYISIHF